MNFMLDIVGYCFSAMLAIGSVCALVFVAFMAIDFFVFLYDSLKSSGVLK